MQQIRKPQNDNCNYETFVLDNKMKVFVVEDNETSLACATMMVKIGYGNDTIPGIAHFLEHMLFNGTRSYPEEKRYTEFITKNGGETNAYTDHDHTCYFYTIQPDQLINSLEMFSSFFIEPLLKKDSVEREMNAVNSEHIKNITSDTWRLHEVLKQAVVKTNPIRKFGTGSNKTLNVHNVHMKVREFFENHYSSDLMTLFVITNNNVKDVILKIKEIFNKVPLNIKPENRQLVVKKIYDTPQLIKVVPLKDIDKITISWDLPSYRSTPTQSPHNFLSHLIGHEGVNTIHYFLTQLGYITLLTAGTSMSSFDRVTFDITVVLTQLGTSHKEDIMYVIIKYIELIKSKINDVHLERLYNELIILDAFDFKFCKKKSPEEKTQFFAELVNACDFDLHDLLILPYANEEFNPNIKNNLLEVLNLMTIENSVVMLISKLYEDKTDKILEHYDTKYSIIQTYPDLTFVNIDTKILDLPLSNKFISTNCEIINENEKSPKKINHDTVKLYCKKTNEFKTPETIIEVKIDLPLSNYDKETYVNTLLYFNTILAEINCDIYMCRTARFDINVYFSTGKLYISIGGNNGGIENVCNFLVSSLLNKELITEKIYNTAHYSQYIYNLNCVFGSPYTRLNNFFKKQVCSYYYDNNDYLEVLKNSSKCNINTVKNILGKILEKTNCTMLVIGNCSDEMAYNVANIFSKFVPMNKYEPDTLMCDIIDEPDEYNNKLFRNVENNIETNSAFGYYVFIEKIKYGLSLNWNKHICLLNVLDTIISTDYFDELRTQEEFGYICNGSVESYGNKRCYARFYKFIVQSPHKTPDEILERTEKFINDCKTKLENITTEELQDIITAKISTLNAPFNNLNEMANFIFGYEIETGYESFNLKDILVDTYNKISKRDIKNFFNDKFIENRKYVTVGLQGNIIK